MGLFVHTKKERNGVNLILLKTKRWLEGFSFFLFVLFCLFALTFLHLRIQKFLKKKRPKIRREGKKKRENGRSFKMTESSPFSMTHSSVCFPSFYLSHTKQKVHHSLCLSFFSTREHRFTAKSWGSPSMSYSFAKQT